MCIMTEYHMRSDNMSAEIRLLGNSRSQTVANFVMWGKAPRGPVIPHNYSK